MQYTEKDLVKIAKREKNSKRGYLVVNPLQGKHIPVSPSKALAMFAALADKLKGRYAKERLLLVGFAETATAIGAHAAACLGARYIQTTRESLPGARCLFFSESHSHATEQRLVMEELDGELDEIDRIIFVEDEVTTGNTILHLIAALEERRRAPIRYAVASLLNGMGREHLLAYQERGIDLHYLVKTDHSAYGAIAEAAVCNGSYYGCAKGKPPCVTEVSAPGWMDARRLVDGPQYEMACGRLWESVANRIGTCEGQRMLVVGTEEFMYPALIVASRIEGLGNDVRFHATTRSPIAVSAQKGYPLHQRHELISLYDAQRRTFLYEIGAYDRVLVITDAHLPETDGTESLVYALSKENSEIMIVRWR